MTQRRNRCEPCSDSPADQIACGCGRSIDRHPARPTDGARSHEQDRDREPLLTLTAEQMAGYGQAVMDLVVRHFAEIDQLPAATSRTAEQMRAILGDGRLPWEPTDFDVVLGQTIAEILPGNCLPAHPRYLAFVPSASTFVSVLGDLLATAFNLWPATWMTASAATAVELEAIGWLCQIAGLPDDAGGLFVSGGSTANLTALIVARNVKLGGPSVPPEAVAYASSQTHSSVARALMVMGFAKGQLRQVPVDDELRMDVAALRDMIDHDRAEGLKPFCVIGTAGTTGTGAVDPLTDLAQLSRQEDMWFHVDAAIGGAARLGTIERHLVEGIAEADSITFDPHKGLMQPFEMGCVLVRDRRLMRSTFATHPEYLQDTVGQDDDEPNLCDYGIQLARGGQALKLWLSMRTFGGAAFSQGIDHAMGLARVAEHHLRQQACWEVTTAAQLGIVTFRYVAGGPEHLDEVQTAIAEMIRQDGFAMVCTTRVRGDAVLRLAMTNPRTTRQDVLETIDRLAAYGAAALETTEHQR